MGIGKTELAEGIDKFLEQAKSRGARNAEFYLQDEYYRHFAFRPASPGSARRSFDEQWPGIEQLLAESTGGVEKVLFVAGGEPIELTIEIPTRADLNGYYCAQYLLNPDNQQSYEQGPTAERIKKNTNNFAEGVARDLAGAVKAGELQVPEAQQAAYTTNFIASVVAANFALRRYASTKWTHAAMTDSQLRDNEVDPAALHAIGSRRQLRMFTSDLGTKSRTTLYEGKRTLDSEW